MNTTETRMLNIAFGMIRAIYWENHSEPGDCPRLIADEEDEICQHCEHWHFCQFEAELNALERADFPIPNI